MLRPAAVHSAARKTEPEMVLGSVCPQLVGGFAIVASYTVRHSSDVLSGTEKSDTFTALSLDFAF